MKSSTYKKIEKIAKKFNFTEFEIMTNYGLFCGSNNLFKTAKIIEFVNYIKHLNGDIIEFGVWNGNTSFLIKKLIDIFKIKKKLFLFDHFRGLDKISSKDIKKFEGMYKGNLELINEIINFFKLKNIKIIKRDANKVNKNFFKNMKFSLVIIDVDLYLATKNILESIHPCITKGGIIVFDEANKKDFPGEKLAMNEFFKKYKKHYSKEILSKDLQPDVLLKKIT